MTKIVRLLMTILFLIILGGSFPKEISAGDEACTDPSYPVCYPSRSFNEWSCSQCSGSNYGWYCTGNGNPSCENAYGDPIPSTCTPWGGNCISMCDPEWTGSCLVTEVYLQCNTSFNNAVSKRSFFSTLSILHT